MPSQSHVPRPKVAPRTSSRLTPAIAILFLLAGALGVAVPVAGADPTTATSSTTGTSTTTSTNTEATPSATNRDWPLKPGALLGSGAGLDGTGSSFAANAVETWVSDVGNAPYNLNISWTTSNSGQGRYEFTNQTTDYAVSDIGYVGNTDTTPPSFPFNFIPITAGGIAFMYHIPGLSKQLQLSSYTACALMTGGIKNWDDPAIAADNPGVTLPSLAVVPVTESDSAGTNFVLEEWCIDEQPAIWSAFATAQEQQSGGPTDGVAISTTSPNSNWPGVQGGLDDGNTTAVAGDVATTAGAIGGVQVQYAKDLGFYGTNPAQNVALVKNASGDYTPPTPVDVASALAYATQQSNGTHVLNFNGLGPHVYNPSTYSYLLTPTTGWPSAKGATMSAFINFALTLGQQQAPTFGYASLGLSLEQYGINAVTTNVPGSVAPTAAEKAAYACGDLTPSEVAAGQTSPTCGVVNQTAAPPPPNGGTATGSSSTTTATTSKSALANSTHAETSSSSSDGSSSGVSPFVSLSAGSGLPNTGMDPVPVALAGFLLTAIGLIGRRRALKRRRQVTR
jgi:ABC-type phosphate transport system substrate-binding protein